MHGRSQYVLVGNAHISHVFAGSHLGLYRFLRSLGYLGNEHRLAVDRIGVHGNIDLRLAVEPGRRLDHVNLLFGAHPGNTAVVLHPDEQPAPVGIGKGRQRAGYLAGIGDFELEILLLVLSLVDELLQIGFVGYRLHTCPSFINLRRR